MAILESINESTVVPDNTLIQDVAEELGVSFGCRKGNCGTCLTVVLEGMQNLSSITEKEIDFGVKKNERLICQCHIKTGKVKLAI